jgi:hypothetical protein
VTWARYFLTKIRVSFAQSIRSYELGKIKEREIYDHVVKNVVQGRLTFKRLFKGAEMTPTFASQGETLLIRSLPRPSPRSNVTSIQYTDLGTMPLLHDVYECV